MLFMTHHAGHPYPPSEPWRLQLSQTVHTVVPPNVTHPFCILQDHVDALLILESSVLCTAQASHGKASATGLEQRAVCTVKQQRTLSVVMLGG